MTTKPLFIPLKAEHYDAFARGDKTCERRLYGPRWNERTCPVGRKVVLSRGYGKKHRMHGHIASFLQDMLAHFTDDTREALLGCYPKAGDDTMIIEILIHLTP